MRGDVHLADMTAGDFFGEIAMTGLARRTASVRATTPMRLLVMGRPQFQSMSSLLPAVTERVNARIAERIENSNLSGAEPGEITDSKPSAATQSASSAIAVTTISAATRPVTSSPITSGA